MLTSSRLPAGPADPEGKPACSNRISCRSKPSEPGGILGTIGWWIARVYQLPGEQAGSIVLALAR